jgi:phosphoadenosine phosphosulfate reductase
MTDRMELLALADHARVDLEDASAEEILAWTAATFGDRWAVASSMQDALLVHLATRARPGVDVLFLDTGYHFAETIITRNFVELTYPIRLIDVRPRQSVAQQDAEHGARLYERRPDECCRLRKVQPLRQALGGYDAWVTAVRRDEGPTRADTPVVTWDEAFGLVKVNPLARWTQADADVYIERHGVLLNPLVPQGYPSIGCAPCTRAVAPGDDPRSGRWAGFGKTECGLHPATHHGGTT